MFDPKDKLPENNTYVLAFFPDSPWHDKSCKNDEHKFRVVKFKKGISLEERAALPEGERKRSYYSEDEYGNNRVPYCWEEFGPGSFFGQECALWCYLPLLKRGY
jgi:hypothetical protein